MKFMQNEFRIYANSFIHKTIKLELLLRIHECDSSPLAAAAAALI
jgi:hypothetical protein